MMHGFQMAGVLGVSGLVGLALLVGCKGKEQTAVPEPEPAEPAKIEEAEPKPVVADYETAIGSTVLVTTPWGHGTGVFVDPAGFVLTNYHVISPGKSADFGYEAQVTMATLQEDGSVEIGEKFSAQAYKVDPKRDLALLKIETQGREFPSLPVAPEDPKPGGQVLAIGNAGVGFGWAVKRCSVNAIGTYDAFASVIFSKQQQDEGNDNPMQKAMLEEFTKAAGEKGKQIQTDCNVLPGDSGGPLVDTDTYQIVGLNVAIRSATAGFSTLGSVAFHVHVSEIRDFLKEIPDRPDLDLPDPWQVAGVGGGYLDGDFDGEYDTIRFEGTCNETLRCFATLTDLDQSSFGSKKTLPPLADIREDKAFDAELAVLELGRPPRKPSASNMGLPVSDRLVYADTNDDGRFNRLILHDGESGETRGYRIDDKGAQRDEKLDGFAMEGLPELYKSKKLRKRAKVISAALTGEVVRPDNPDKATALDAELRDFDTDGTVDAVRASTRLDTRVLVDVDQDSLNEIRTAARRMATRRSRGRLNRRLLAQIEGQRAASELRKGHLRGEFLAIMGTPARVFYDTDLDGSYDLLLEGPSIDSVAFRATTLGEAGAGQQAAEHIGRRLLRPGLIAEASMAERLDAIMENAFAGQPRADAKDGASSFPSIARDRVLAARPIDDTDGAAVTVLDAHAVTVLVDVDRDTFKGKHRGADALEAVRGDHFDAELAYRYAYGMAWAFYDADDDGRFELILVSRPGYPTTAGAAFSVDSSGVVSTSAEHVGQPMIQVERFSKKARKLVENVKARIDRGEVY